MGKFSFYEGPLSLGVNQPGDWGDPLQAYAGVRAVVLGASGFIGRWVSFLLCRQEASLSLFVRDRAVAEAIFSRYGIQGEIHEIDLRNLDALQTRLQGIQPAITFNLAAYGVIPSQRDEELAYQINAELVKALSEILARVKDTHWQGCQLVQVGSALEYGAIGGDLSEDSAPNPTTLYGKTKLAGTRYLSQSCQLYGLQALTARLFTVYGPGEQCGRLLPSLLEISKTGNSLPMTSGRQKRDFIFVEEAAEGLLRLGLSSALPGEIVNLASGELTTIKNFVEKATEVLQIPPDRLVFGALPTRAEEMEHAPVAIGRLKQLTGWAPSMSIDEGLRRTRDFDSNRIWV